MTALLFVAVTVLVFACIAYGLSILIPALTDSATSGANPTSRHRDIGPEEA